MIKYNESIQRKVTYAVTTIPLGTKQTSAKALQIFSNFNTELDKSNAIKETRGTSTYYYDSLNDALGSIATMAMTFIDDDDILSWHIYDPESRHAVSASELSCLMTCSVYFYEKAKYSNNIASRMNRYGCDEMYYNDRMDTFAFNDANNTGYKDMIKNKHYSNMCVYFTSLQTNENCDIKNIAHVVTSVPSWVCTDCKREYDYCPYKHTGSKECSNPRAIKTDDGYQKITLSADERGILTRCDHKRISGSVYVPENVAKAILLYRQTKKEENSPLKSKNILNFLDLIGDANSIKCCVEGCQSSTIDSTAPKIISGIDKYSLCSNHAISFKSLMKDFMSGNKNENVLHK